MSKKNTTIASTLVLLSSLLIGCGGSTQSAKHADPNAKSQLVVFIGDSITACWTDDCFGIASPGLPWQNGIQAGVPGDTSSGMLARFQHDVIDNHPAVVVIECYCNDFTINSAPLEDIEPNIGQMINLALINNIRVVLTSTLPNDFTGIGTPYYQFTQDYNAFAQSIADSTTHVAFANYYPALTDQSTGLGNPVEFANGNCCHPGPLALSIMAPIVDQAIEKALSQ